MYPIRSAEIFKFRTVIRLKHLGSISETGDRPLNKVDCREAALFLVRENKAFTGSLVNHSVLVEFLAVFACVEAIGTYFTSICHFSPNFSGVSYFPIWRLFFLVNSGFFLNPGRTNTR